jgi:hypothetical protein
VVTAARTNTRNATPPPASSHSSHGRYACTQHTGCRAGLNARGTAGDPTHPSPGLHKHVLRVRRVALRSDGRHVTAHHAQWSVVGAGASGAWRGASSHPCATAHAKLTTNQWFIGQATSPPPPLSPCPQPAPVLEPACSAPSALNNSCLPCASTAGARGLRGRPAHKAPRGIWTCKRPCGPS